MTRARPSSPPEIGTTRTLAPEVTITCDRWGSRYTRSRLLEHAAGGAARARRAIDPPEHRELVARRTKERRVIARDDERCPARVRRADTPRERATGARAPRGSTSRGHRAAASGAIARRARALRRPRARVLRRASNRSSRSVRAALAPLRCAGRPRRASLRPCTSGSRARTTRPRSRRVCCRRGSARSPHRASRCATPRDPREVARIRSRAREHFVELLQPSVVVDPRDGRVLHTPAVRARRGGGHAPAATEERRQRLGKTPRSGSVANAARAAAGSSASEIQLVRAGANP